MKAIAKKSGTVATTEQHQDKVLTVVKSEVVTVETTDNKPQPMTFEDRRKIFNKANGLLTNYEAMSEKLKELEELHFSDDNANIGITFRDEQAQQWTTRHPKIVAFVQDKLKEAFNERILELKSEIEALKVA